MSSCGNPQSTDADELMPRRLKFGRSRVCVRCRENPGNIVIRHAVYCRDCFSPLVTMKFRKALQPAINASAGTSKRPRLKAEGNLLMAFSGGLGSSVLLDIIHSTYFSGQPPVDEDGNPVGGKKHPRNASVWPSASVCYVEVCSAFPGMRDRTEEVRGAVEQYPSFEFVPLRVEDAFDKSWWEQVGGAPSAFQLSVDLGIGNLSLASASSTPPDLTPVESMRTYLASLPTPTAVSSAIQNLVRMLTLHAARSRGASHLLLGTSLTSLSIGLISSISQGGGYATREELQEEWTPSGFGSTETSRPISIVRPLRDVTMKECAAYAWWNDIKIVGRDKSARAIQGIANLTKDFIVGLEKDYPSTVSTIARTCAKLAPKDAPNGNCILCQRPVQHGIQEWKSRISIRSYADAKLALAAHTHPSSQCDPPAQPLDPMPSLTPRLCYSCHTTLTSRSSRGLKTTGHLPAPLPVWSKQSGQSEMRDAIADYLLDG
ncbi:hypothetical protein BV22DRAFT_1104929 [Leucogyrophana mollusca]|uniref:Uncharacterized protein n=1 Tax=Leucogyrophana mollusca TaxID=85980 RepID=A0ACB8BLQ5_9AGAM|nr:hypothetical protein BV22DRAFT_1104929 [Leucogyrophana mollusca]